VLLRAGQKAYQKRQMGIYVTHEMNRLKALYRSWAIPCGGKEVYGDTDAKVHAGLGRKLLMNRGQSHNQIQWAGARRTETPHPSCTQAPWERRLASLLFR
jgi:hypothetical protein